MLSCFINVALSAILKPAFGDGKHTMKFCSY